MKILSLNTKGVILLQVMLFILLLSIAGATSMLVVMGRSMTVAQMESTEKAGFSAQAAESRLNDCLFNVTNAASCASAVTGCSGFPMTMGRKIIRVASYSWTGSACKVTLRVQDVP